MGNTVSWRVDQVSQGMPLSYEHDGQKVSARDFGFKKVEFDVNPFRFGKFREAYKGKVFLQEGQSTLARESLRCWGFRKDRPFVPCIVKAFKRRQGLFAAEWEKDLSLLKEAQSWSCKFNDRDLSKIEIEFADALLYEVVGSGAEFQAGICKKRNVLSKAKVQKKEKVCVEPLLEGPFVKANGNNGFVAEQSGDNVEFLEVAQAFSHYTYAASERLLLVCDLQGVYESSDGAKKWKFTDPAIHSAVGKQQFGQTDLGPRGINAFFRTHKCNHMCRELPRPEVVVDVGFGPIASHTTFSFEYIQISEEVHSQLRNADILGHPNAGTCYAHAAATVVRAAERRIVGRKLEEHFSMVARLVAKYGTKGASVAKVLEVECPARNMHYQFIDATRAAEAVDLGRAILLSFRLTDAQWSEFTCFFRQSPSDILDSLPDSNDQDTSGHAVVIVGHNDQSWMIKKQLGG